MVALPYLPRLVLALGCAWATGLCARAQAPEKATLYLGWRAEPEFGGFFQALETGLYRRHGIDAEIKLGSPQSNSEIVLALHKADFIEGSSGDAVSFLKQGIPLVTVAALFQKSPRVLIAHAGQGSDTLEQMKGKPILVGAQALTTVWPFLRARFGFSDDQLRPYTFNEAPFLRDPQIIQEGFVTEEPFVLAHLGVPKPVVILLSDHGYEEYAMALITNRETAQKRPAFVQHFVDATIEGWKSYLTGDPTPANRYIRENNPDISEQQIAYAIATMRERGLVESGDTPTKGIGTMSDQKWEGFYQTLVQAGAAPAGLDIHQAYTLKFVNQGVGR